MSVFLPLEACFMDWVLDTSGGKVKWKVSSEKKNQVHIRVDLSQQKCTTELITEITTLHVNNDFFAS